MAFSFTDDLMRKILILAVAFCIIGCSPGKDVTKENKETAALMEEGYSKQADEQTGKGLSITVKRFEKRYNRMLLKYRNSKNEIFVPERIEVETTPDGRMFTIEDPVIPLSATGSVDKDGKSITKITISYTDIPGEAGKREQEKTGFAAWFLNHVINAAIPDSDIDDIKNIKYEMAQKHPFVRKEGWYQGYRLEKKIQSIEKSNTNIYTITLTKEPPAQKMTLDQARAFFKKHPELFDDEE